MYLRTLLIVVALGILALFTAANWSAFVAPTTLSLIFATVEAPLGVVLLATIVLLTALFLLYVVYLQSSVLLDARRHSRELNAQRELAEHAEVSRFHELRAFVEAQLQTLSHQTEQSKADLTDRLDQLEGDLRHALEQSQNTLSAYMAEIEDRLERGGTGQMLARKPE